MLIKNLKECEEFIGKDKTTLREVLHPKNDNVLLSCSLAYAKLKPGDSSLPHRLRAHYGMTIQQTKWYLNTLKNNI